MAPAAEPTLESYLTSERPPTPETFIKTPDFHKSIAPHEEARPNARHHIRYICVLRFAIDARAPIFKL